MQGLALGSRLLRSSSCGSTCDLLGPMRQMCMRRVSRELAAEDDSHEFKTSRIKASDLQLDRSFRMRDELEMSRPQRKNPVTTFLNVAMIAAAAGIATALCRELLEERRLQKARYQVRPAPLDRETSYAMQPHPLKVKLDLVMSRQQELEEELASLGAQQSTRSTARRRKEISQEQKALEEQKMHLMEDAKQLLLHQEC
ncbi:g4151 [Coccomyxa viridis]|uniref:G4151 protein n=1 Tax=Coccomyxa viridis TaxID=1274662 RepID=A0ABP1FUY2_9CHLO